MESCISFVPVLHRPIPLGVQTGYIFRQEVSINFKFGLYAEGSCTYRCALFVNFYLIRYGDTAMQSNCTFFVHSAPLTYYNLVPATPRHEYTITSRAHATVLNCTTEVPPFLQTSVVLFYNGQDSLSDRNDSATVTIQKTRYVLPVPIRAHNIM